MAAKPDGSEANFPTSEDVACWTPSAVARISAQRHAALPLIAESDVVRVLPGMDLWDSWPVTEPDGSVARIAGREFWMALTAPIDDDPLYRHHHARIRLLERDGRAWRDRGRVLPEGANPGSREWAGSAIYEAARNALTLFFTATGRRGEQSPTYEQRICQATCRVCFDRDIIRLADWSDPAEAVRADDAVYMRVDQADGKPGEIKAFRDPAYFRDPEDGSEYLLFTGSLKQSRSAYNGAIGIVKASDAKREDWSLLPPLVTADGVNNELERPHVVRFDGRYYLFWSTQRHVFNPDGPIGPTGLYGMVADRLLGPYRPLNGTGLVAANPEEEPMQVYSWTVLNTLEVAAFIDHWGLEGRAIAKDAGLARQQFGGTFAPFFRLQIDGDRTRINNTAR